MASKSSRNQPRPAATTTLGTGNVLVQFATMLPGNAATDVGKPTRISIAGTSADIVTWGEKNDLPNYREELIQGNNIVPALVKRKRDIICGQDWYAYRERFEDGSSGPIKRIMDEVPMTPDQKAFFRMFKPEARKLVGELCKHEFGIAEFILNMDGSLAKIKRLETKHVRAGRKNAIGEIVRYWWSNAWTNEQQKQTNTQDRVLRELPVYDETLSAEKRQDRFVLPLCDDLLNDGYYPIPSYWGGRYWIELANSIPIFHLANLRNLSAPRWLLIIPHDYFRDYVRWNAALTDADRDALLTEEMQKKQAFVDDFNTLVTGLENNGRTLTIESIQEEVYGKLIDKRITVEPLVIDLRDEALIKLYEASNVANISAQGLHPTLANIETQGRLSSGTEIRNAYLLWLIIAAPAYREYLYQIVDLAKKINGWPEDIHFAIRDAELTTLAENPGGMQPSETPIAA